MAMSNIVGNVLKKQSSQATAQRVQYCFTCVGESRGCTSPKKVCLVRRLRSCND